MRNLLRMMVLGSLLFSSAPSAKAAEDPGQALLEKRCGRCHGVVATAPSRLKEAPNLWDTLRAYPTDRLEFELAEGIGSRHPGMPQIQFTAQEIALVKAYLQVE